MAWTNFPMTAGVYSARDRKFLLELYNKQKEINDLHTYGDSISMQGNPSTQAMYSVASGSVVQKLRTNAINMLSNYWFYDAVDETFIHKTKAGVLNIVLGQANWTQLAAAVVMDKQGTPLLDEIYLVTNWIANNMYVRRQIYISNAGWYYGLVGSPPPWYPALWAGSRQNFAEDAEVACDSWEGEAADRTYPGLTAFVIYGDHYNDAGTSKWLYDIRGDVSTVLISDATGGIATNDATWTSALTDGTDFKLWYGNGLMCAEYYHYGNNVGCISVPVKLDGILVGTLNSGGDHTWRDLVLDIDAEDLDFENGTAINYDVGPAEMADEIFVPPDKQDDVIAWADDTAYAPADNVYHGGPTVYYQCIQAHTSGGDGDWSAGTYSLGDRRVHSGNVWIVVVASTTEEPDTGTDWELDNDEPGVGNAWQNYWEVVGNYGWYRGDKPAVGEYTKTDYVWTIPCPMGIMVKPYFSWS